MRTLIKALLAFSVFALFAPSAPRAQPPGAPVAEPTPEPTPGSLQSDPAIVSQVQSALRAKGIYTGPVDGKYSPETQEAVRRMQASAGLEPSGQIDAKTLAALAAPTPPKVTIRNERRQIPGPEGWAPIPHPESGYPKEDWDPGLGNRYNGDP